jgi:hypothetical protein
LASDGSFTKYVLYCTDSDSHDQSHTQQLTHKVRDQEWLAETNLSKAPLIRKAANKITVKYLTRTILQLDDDVVDDDRRTRRQLTLTAIMHTKTAPKHTATRHRYTYAASSLHNTNRTSEPEHAA